MSKCLGGNIIDCNRLDLIDCQDKTLCGKKSACLVLRVVHRVQYTTYYGLFYGLKDIEVLPKSLLAQRENVSSKL